MQSLLPLRSLSIAMDEKRKPSVNHQLRPLLTIANVERKLSLRGAKRRACTPKWRYGTQAWQSQVWGLGLDLSY
jgi:hypothetical protein